jgi:hypothetical protein
MSQVLTLEINDDLYADLRQQAEKSGMTMTEWAINSLREYKQLNNIKTLSETEKELARIRFRTHAGAINLGLATGADNDSIDADLPKVYDNELVGWAATKIFCKKRKKT